MRKLRKKSIGLLVILSLILTLFAGSFITVFAAGNTISRSKAQAIALKSVNVNKSAVNKWKKVKLDHYDKEWDIEFCTKTYKYEVEINAVSGKVKDVDREKIKTTKLISKGTAKKLALKAVNVKTSAVKKWTKVKLDGDNEDWEVKFSTKSYRYEIEINARSGKIEDIDKEKIVQKSTKYIGVDKAKAIAKKHAKVNGTVKYTKAKLDKDDGVHYYDIEFKKNGVEYEYEINAKSGKIMDWDIEEDD